MSLSSVQGGFKLGFRKISVSKSFESLFAFQVTPSTGYKHNFPFLPEDLKLKTTNRLVPDDLYNQVVYIQNPNIFYVGMQNQVYSFNMFQLQVDKLILKENTSNSLQGYYIRDLICGKLELPDRHTMTEDFKADMASEDKIEKTVENMAVFQSGYMTKEFFKV